MTSRPILPCATVLAETRCAWLPQPRHAPLAGSGWCPFNDILLAVHRVRQASGGDIRNVLVVDTDVHQGNGVERMVLRQLDRSIVIMDVYNADIWPQDEAARPAIDVERRLRCGACDDEYLAAVTSGLDDAFALVANRCRQRGAAGCRGRDGKPDLVVHNAGTDVLAGDPLGRCVRESTRS